MTSTKKTKKKRGRGKAKGSSFERWVCKELSKWWDGERDDIFWRTAGSGGRATSRSKRGQTTSGQYGDVQATDPSGEPLIKLCTIEIKRIKRHKNHSYFDLVDGIDPSTNNLFIKHINQAVSQAEEAGTFGWLLISKTDHKNTLVIMPTRLARGLKALGTKLAKCRPSGYIYSHLDGTPINLYVTTFAQFTEWLTPQNIIDCYKRREEDEEE